MYLQRKGSYDRAQIMSESMSDFAIRPVAKTSSIRKGANVKLLSPTSSSLTLFWFKLEQCILVPTSVVGCLKSAWAEPPCPGKAIYGTVEIAPDAPEFATLTTLPPQRHANHHRAALLDFRVTFYRGFIEVFYLASQAIKPRPPARRNMTTELRYERSGKSLPGTITHSLSGPSPRVNGPTRLGWTYRTEWWPSPV